MNRNATDYWYLHDGLGSVSELIDETGSTVYEKYVYDPYGNVTIYDSDNQEISESAIGNPYYYTGRRHDFESGLYYYRARYYDPTIGRFLQRDPIGTLDHMNLYQYTGNNPLNWIDPWGLCSEKATWLDWMQGGLDLAGLIPGIGEPFDLANAGLYGLRGD